MAGRLQLTEQLNPMAQTFRVTEPGGSVITKVGLFFERCPKSADTQIPVVVELRPVVEGGNPSSQRFIPGTRVVKTAADVRTVVNAAGGTDGVGATFGSTAEVTFEFPEPVFVPGNTEMAIVVSTAAPAGQYKVFAGTQGENELGSTSAKVASQLDAGVFFQSSNGTAWTPDQNTDIAFKVYRAIFNATGNRARLEVSAPPKKKLTENTYTQNIVKYPSSPLITTNTDSDLKVLHPSHGFLKGDTVNLSGLDSSTTYGGVFGSSIMGDRIIKAVDPYGYTISMDSPATSSVRTGGSGVIASEQYVINDFMISIPNQQPTYTNIYVNGSFTTTTSMGGSETNGTKTNNVSAPLGQITRLVDPHVVLSSENEVGDSASTYFDVGMDTENKYVAPYINVEAAALFTVSNFIDYQDSAVTDFDGDGDSDRNLISTISWTAETEPDGGTTASKHLTIPFVLENDATSIRVLMDARRPNGSDFSVWYRTAQTASDTKLEDQNWVEFSKSINPPNKSNYDQMEQSETYKEYEFNVFDIQSFDEYQIKITFNSNRSSNVPTIRNLRTIATV